MRTERGRPGKPSWKISLPLGDLRLQPAFLVFKLVSVNGVDFRIISHFDAVRMFKENSEFLIVAKYSPYGKISQALRYFTNTFSRHLKSQLYIFQISKELRLELRPL